MRFSLPVTFLVLLSSANPSMAQSSGTVSAMHNTPDKREINNAPISNSYGSIHNEAMHQPSQRQDDASNNTVNSRGNISSAYKNEQLGTNLSIRQNDYYAYEKNNGYIAPLIGNTAHSLPAQNDYINPGGGTIRPRYSAATHKYHYYSSSDYTRTQCENICKGIHWGAGGNIVEHLKFGPDGRLYSYWPLAARGLIFNPLVYVYSIRRDLQLIADNSSKHSNSSQYFSFDGYVVYNTDTIVGIVTITHNEVALDRPINKPNRNYYNYHLKDKQLKAIVAYKGPKELHLVRLSPADKNLSRMVHNGKVSLYDKSFNFLTSDNISNSLQIVDRSTGQISTLKGKSELTAIVNKAYNLSIQPELITWKELITVINRLD